VVHVASMDKDLAAMGAGPAMKEPMFDTMHRTQNAVDVGTPRTPRTPSTARMGPQGPMSGASRMSRTSRTPRSTPRQAHHAVPGDYPQLSPRQPQIWSAAYANRSIGTPSSRTRRNLKGQPNMHPRVLELQARLAKMHVTTGQLFRFMDVDRTDTISFGEFCRGLDQTAIRPMPTVEEKRLLFDSFDQDASRSVSYSEMLRSLEQTAGKKRPGNELRDAPWRNDHQRVKPGVSKRSSGMGASRPATRSMPLPAVTPRSRIDNSGPSGPSLVSWSHFNRKKGLEYELPFKFEAPMSMQLAV